jgi:hypothetical protein
MALFIIGLPHPGDGITLRLVRGETGMLQVDVAESLGMCPSSCRPARRCTLRTMVCK